jgi:hypothetical protein
MYAEITKDKYVIYGWGEVNLLSYPYFFWTSGPFVRSVK